MRIFVATLGSEIDFFSPIPTSLATFEVSCLKRPPLDDDDRNWAAATQIRWKRRARERGFDVTEGLCAHAMPAGLPPRALYESLRDELLAGLARALPVDAVLYHLHGALCAEEYDDCEGDLLERTRSLVGPAVAIGGLFDLHAHLTKRMLEHATVLVGLKEFPHVDYAERADELFDLVVAAAERRTSPVMSLFDCRMIGCIHTTREPMRGFVDRLGEMEGRDGVLSITVNHGFAHADIPDMGTKVLVVTDKRRAEGDALAERLGRELFAMRDQVVSNYLSIEEGLELALGHGQAPGPVVMADCDDNPGGGAPGDTAFVLRALLDRGVENAALAYLWDPVAVQLANAVGEGGRLRLRIGGKTPISGDPVDVDATVVSLREDFHQTGYGSDVLIALGDCARIHASGVDIVLSSHREQVLSRDAFEGFGIDPHDRRLLVVKSTQHFHAAFAPIASHIYYVSRRASGTPASELLGLPYTRISRPKWPFDPDPHRRVDSRPR